MSTKRQCHIKFFSHSLLFLLQEFVVILISVIVFTILKREILNVYFEIKKTDVFPYCLLGEGGI